MKPLLFLEKLRIPITLSGVFICLTTILIHFDILWGKYWWAHRWLDLRREKFSVAEGFSSFLGILIAASILVIVRNRKVISKISSFKRKCLWLIGAAFLFFAVDEAAAIHEKLGSHLEAKTGIFKDTPIFLKGFSWMFIYVPIIIFFVVIIFMTYKTLGRLYFGSYSIRMKTFGIAILASMPMWIIAIEIREAFMCVQGTSPLTLTLIEEIVELSFLMALYLMNVRIQKNLGKCKS